MTLNVVYFAWLRERIGLPQEAVSTEAATVADLVDELRSREERYALASPTWPRCALPSTRS